MIDEPGAVFPAAAESRDEIRPSRFGLVALSLVLGGSYLCIQLLVTLPILVWLLATKQILYPREELDSPAMILGALAGLGIAASVTILVALVWPRLWRALRSGDGPSFGAWLGWRDVRIVPVWAIPMVTIPLAASVALVISQLVGSSEVNAQLKLFASPQSRVLTSILVTTVVPVAEEFIFRGALFNALTPVNEGMSAWQANLRPVIVTTVIFAAIHRIAGVDTLAGMLQITVLSLYLGLLRAVTGSVKSSIAAHVTWNALGALALSLANVHM